MMLTALLLCVLAIQQTTGEPREPAGTGEIRGRVTDADSGRPLPGARVILGERTRNQTRMATTDDGGAFRFAGLSPGRYEGFVDPGALRGSHTEQALLADRARQNTLELSKGEVRILAVALPRAHAIGLRVVNEDGDPLSGLRVVVRSADGAGGFPIRGATDDRGRMRLFGLRTGRYVVCAEPDGQLTSGRTPRRDAFLRTCYPDVTDEARAEAIRVERTDVEGIDIQMQRGRTYTVSGRVLDATGAPAATPRVGLARYVPGGSTTTFVPVTAQGTFTISNLPRGDYAIETSLGGPERPEQQRALEVAWQPIAVDAGDIENLVVTLGKTVEIAGRVVTEDGSALPAAGGSGLTINLRLVEDRTPSSGSRQYAIVRADRTFSATGLFGRRVVSFDNVPDGWYVKSVRHAGNDVIDSPIDMATVRAGESMEVVLSNRGAVVTGRVVDDAGLPAPRAMVYLIRLGADAPLSGRASYAVASETGAFRFGPIRGGDYAIVAAPRNASMLQRYEWDRTAKLIELGDRVTLTELDERSIVLRVLKEVPR